MRLIANKRDSSRGKQLWTRLTYLKSNSTLAAFKLRQLIFAGAAAAAAVMPQGIRNQFYFIIIII